MDKMGLSFKSFRTLVVLGSITFSILITFSLMHQNSIFQLVDGFSKIDVLAARPQNATTNVLEQGDTTVTVKAGGGKDQNITEVGKGYHCFKPIIVNNCDGRHILLSSCVFDSSLLSYFI